MRGSRTIALVLGLMVVVVAVPVAAQVETTIDAPDEIRVWASSQSAVVNTSLTVNVEVPDGAPATLDETLRRVVVIGPSGTRPQLDFTPVGDTGSAAGVVVNEIGTWKVVHGGQVVSEVWVIGVPGDDGTFDLRWLLWIVGVVALVGIGWWERTRGPRRSAAADALRPGANPSAQDSWWAGG